MGADDISAALHELLSKAGFHLEATKNIASHSLKATWLTILGKFGISAPERQLLGYHVVKGEESAINYNRDNLAIPMENMTKVIKMVRIGSYDPDAARGSRRCEENLVNAVCRMENFLSIGRLALANMLAQRWVTEQEHMMNGGWVHEFADKPNEEVEAEVELEEGEVMDEYGAYCGEQECVNVGVADEQEGSMSFMSQPQDDVFETAVSADDAEAVCNAEEHVALSVAAALAGTHTLGLSVQASCMKRVRHTVRMTVHFMSPHDEGRFACGRHLTHVYEEHVDSMPMWPLCKDCYPNA